mgnify:CR=1 FL=1
MKEFSKGLIDLIIGFQKSQVLTTAVRMNIFTEIETKKPSKVNRRLKALLDALVSMGLLQPTEDGWYKNTLVSKILLDRNSDWNICDFVLHNGVNLYPIWSKLYDVITENRPALAKTHDLIVPYYIFGLSSLAPSSFPFLDRIGEPQSILDVGCGGLWASLLFRELFPSARIVAVDRPDVCALIQRLAKTYEIELRATEDYTTTKLGRKFDLAFVSEVIHGKSPFDAERLLRKCHSDLKRGGVIVVREYFEDTLYRSLFNLTLALCTKEGRVYGFEEVKGMLERSGFYNIVKVEDEGDPLGRGYALGYKR